MPGVYHKTPTATLNRNRRAIEFARQRALELSTPSPFFGPPSLESLEEAEELRRWADDTEKKLQGG